MILGKYKKDFTALFILGIIYLIYCFVFWGRAGDVMIDCPRELYIPQRINDGKELFTEIFSLYTPLGYYFNALFVKIFGSSLKVFYLLGSINTFLILLLIYFISRNFSKQLLSFSISFLVLCYCTISYSPVTNYIFPYSYSFIYALTFFLGCIFCLIKYFKSEYKYNYIIIACFLAGLSAGFKPEFLPAVIPVFITLFLKESSFLKIFSAIAVFIFTLIIPFLPNPEGLKIFINNLFSFSSSPSSQEFLKTLSFKTPKEYILSTIKDISFFIVLFLTSLIYLKQSEKFGKVTRVTCFLLYLFISYILISYIYENRIYIFSWLTIVSIVFLGLYLKELINSKSETAFQNMILSSVLVLSSLRVGGYLSSNHYGKYILPLFFVIFFCIYLPEMLKRFEINYEKSVSGILIIFSIFSVFFCGKAVYEGKNYKIQTDRGTVWSTYPVGKTIENTADYIRTNTKETDRVLVLPEGLLVNYLGNRKSDDMFYQLLPNHIEILGESNIVRKLAIMPPEYIVLSSLSTPAYGKTYFCIDYGKEICNFINENYDYLEIFKNKEKDREFMMMIMKLKTQ